MTNKYIKGNLCLRHKLSIVKIFTMLLFMFSLAFTSFSYAETTASVDRLDVTEGNIVNFTIKSDVSSRVEPDVIPLQQFFVVHGQQKSTQMSFINGNVRSFTEWKYMLTPKRVGRIDIPAITVGSEKTAPISIMVSKASSSAGAANGSNTAGSKSSADVFMESNVNTRKVYQNSQLLYVVRLFSATEIENGSWPNPASADALIEKIGDDLVFQDTRAGVMYNVIERRYAIFPSKVGEFDVPSSTFEGTVLSPGSVNTMTVGFGVGALNAFFNTSLPVRVSTEPITVTVVPKPATVTGESWLPAYNIRFERSFAPEPPVWKEGEAVTMTINLTASGLLAARLPDIVIPEIENVRIYPSNSEKTNTLGNKGIVGKISKTVVLMPEQGGTFTLPEMRVEWWNLSTRKTEVAMLSAYTFTVNAAKKRTDSELVGNTAGNVNVQGSANAGQNTRSSVVSSNPDSISVMQDRQKESEAKELKNKRYNSLVIVLGIVFLGLMGLLIYLIVRSRAVAKSMNLNEYDDESEREPRASRLLKDFEKTAKSENTSPKEVADALLKWGKIFFYPSPVLNITEIAEKLKSKKLKKELEELNQSIYAHTNSDFDGELLVQALREAIETKRQEDKKVKPVPELYPEV